MVQNELIALLEKKADELFEIEDSGDCFESLSKSCQDKMARIYQEMGQIISQLEDQSVVEVLRLAGTYEKINRRLIMLMCDRIMNFPFGHLYDLAKDKQIEGWIKKLVFKNKTIRAMVKNRRFSQLFEMVAGKSKAANQLESLVILIICSRMKWWPNNKLMEMADNGHAPLKIKGHANAILKRRGIILKENLNEY